MRLGLWARLLAQELSPLFRARLVRKQVHRGLCKDYHLWDSYKCHHKDFAQPYLQKRLAKLNASKIYFLSVFCDSLYNCCTGNITENSRLLGSTIFKQFQANAVSFSASKAVHPSIQNLCFRNAASDVGSYIQPHFHIISLHDDEDGCAIFGATAAAPAAAIADIPVEHLLLHKVVHQLKSFDAVGLDMHEIINHNIIHIHHFKCLGIT